MSETDLQKLQRLTAEVNSLKEKMDQEAEEKAKLIGKYFIEFASLNESNAESFLKFLDEIIEDKKSHKLAKRKEVKALAEYIAYTVSKNPT
ncbi:hypothetical protein EXE06_18270 [Acinetobacter pittii]|uniref:hypothetical protein n=1 Tax=Acinetobacter pittii TaxID=48296 RepID=UPI001023AE80|nr:hypothetical protein [Acinetobacter pittii]RZG79620.1 hypothetical protein EXE06_18270 [Acinetobacter pittii]RZH50584.1 hypothetical protein EXD88_19005 [Acinetobacter pittii]